MDLGPLTIVLGPNGAGKSTFLDGLDLFAQALSGNESITNLLNRLGGFDELVHGKDRGREIRFLVESKQRPAFQYEVAISRGTGGAAFVLDRFAHKGRILVERRGAKTWVWDAREKKKLDFGMAADRPAVASLAADAERYPEAIAAREFLSDVLLLRLSADACRLPGTAPARRISRDGSGLAELAMHLSQTNRTVWRDISEFVATGVPGLLEVNPIMGADSKIGIMGQLEGVERAVPAQLLSDGTMLLLGIAAVCFDPDPPSVIMIEEPDHGVHARLQEMIMQALRTASRKATVVATTHASTLLAQARSLDEILLVEKGPKGTRFVRPTAQKRLLDWIENHGMASAYETGLLGGVP